MNKIRVLIVDDHPLMREALCAAIEDEPDMTVVGQARNGDEAVAQVRALRPDVTVMDLLLPDKSGVDAITEIVAEDGDAHILALTSSADETMFTAAIQAGALSYLQKDAERTELLHAIRELALGNPYMPPRLVRKLLNSVRAPMLPERQALSLLTEREREIVQFVGQGAANKEIAQRLSLSEGTVRAHIHNILIKLHLKNRHQLAVYAARRPQIHS
jgi:DNA-binding NarL/FixJ family response regulator